MNPACYFCKGKVVEQVTSVDFLWGDDLQIIENVPARICQQCGEKYFEAASLRKWSGWLKDQERLSVALNSSL